MTWLVACSHGTADAVGTASLSALAAAVRRQGVDVAEAYVDVHGPYVADVVRELDGNVVVVPLLLATGYHVRVDIADAVREWPQAKVARALGPDPRLPELLMDRMRTAGVRPDDALVLAAAGSSDERSEESVRGTAESLARLRGTSVRVGYGASRDPRLACEVARTRVQHPDRRVAVASYLLAAGHFQRRVRACGADVITGPLLDPGEPDPRWVELVLDRFAEASSGAPDILTSFPRRL